MSLDDLYRRVIMDHYQHPRNRGIKSDEGIQVHLHNPSCGDRITLQLLMEGDLVKEARFEGEGCSISMSSASMMTEAVKGLTKEEALRKVEKFSCMMMGEGEVEEDLGDLEALQGVSKFPARIKCATLAWKALEKGLQEKEE